MKLGPKLSYRWDKDGKPQSNESNTKRRLQESHMEKLDNQWRLDANDMSSTTKENQNATTVAFSVT